MSADASAYAVLGLEPGADWNAVERAYKALIKVHHPDRPGGDGRRAAEINRAYRELRRSRAIPELVGEPFNDSWFEPPRRRARWLAGLGIAGGCGLLLLLAASSTNLLADLSARSAPPAFADGRAAAPHVTGEPMVQPLDGGAIQAGIADAKLVELTGDEQAMAAASDSCQGALRVRPTLARLDRCAAFDDAIVQLQDRDPWRDDGPFSTIAVSGRQMSGGNLLSNDYLAIEGRLDRIRLAVEVALSPPPLEPELPVNEAD